MKEPLRLSRISGPNDPVVGDGLSVDGDFATIGRLPGSTHCLPHESVSREHATIRWRDGRWTITDEGSTSGTFLNGLRLERSVPAVLSLGDELGIGPWAFRAGGGPQEPERTIALTTTTQPLHVRAPSRRLSALSACIDRLVSAETESELAMAVVNSGLEGTGMRRGAVLKPAVQSGAMSVVAASEAISGDFSQVDGLTFQVPNSLVEHAMQGETAVLSTQRTDIASDLGQSIAEMRVHSAVCVPVRLDGRVVSVLYFDARGGEALVTDVASFCEDIAQVYGLCLGHKARIELLQREATMHAELERARMMREMLAPAQTAAVDRYRVAHRTVAGMFVSGDLVDLIEPRTGLPIVLFGDATGHGVGAAMLIALVHAHLHALISSGMSHPEAIGLTNEYVASHSFDGSFVSIWAASLRPDGNLDVVDAGHGHWFIARASGAVEPATSATSLPLGVAPDTEFVPVTLRLAAGDRVVVYTDGVSEQRGPGGGQIGAQGLYEALRDSRACESDVQRIITEVMVAAGERGVDDDATVASIEYLGAAHSATSPPAE